MQSLRTYKMGNMTSVPVLAAGASLVAVAWLAVRPIYTWRLRRIPGPRRWPLLGNMLSIMAHDDFTVWCQQLIHRYGPVYQVWMGGIPFVVITDAKLARKLLLQTVHKPSISYLAVLVGDDRQVMDKNLLISLQGTSSKFKAFRKMFEAAVLRPSSLATHAGMLAECATRLVLHLDTYAASGQPVDMAVCASMMSLTAIGFAAFGVDFDCFKSASAFQPDGAATADTAAVSSIAPSGQPEWHQMPIGSKEFSAGLVNACIAVAKASDMNQASSWKIPNLLLPQLCTPISYLANWLPDNNLKAELKARKSIVSAMRAMMSNWEALKQSGAVKGGSGGFLTSLLEEREHGADELEVMGQVLTMVFAGFETASVTICQALRMLAAHPEVQARTQQELDTVLQGKAPQAADFDQLPYLCAVVDETLRLWPAGDATLRTLISAEEVQVNNKTLCLPKCDLWINIYAIHRDPSLWPRADEFIPERFLPNAGADLAPAGGTAAAFIPFGLGARMCPGYKFALLESRLALAKMLQKFSFSPAPGCPPTKMNSGIVYGPDHVWLNITSRRS